MARWMDPVCTYVWSDKMFVELFINFPPADLYPQLVCRCNERHLLQDEAVSNKWYSVSHYHYFTVTCTYLQQFKMGTQKVGRKDILVIKLEVSNASPENTSKFIINWHISLFLRAKGRKYCRNPLCKWFFDGETKNQIHMHTKFVWHRDKINYRRIQSFNKM